MEVPAELWYLILSHLPLATQLDKIGPVTLVKLAQSCLFMREIAFQSSIWEPHYKSKWNHSDPVEESIRLQKHDNSFHLMFIEREHLDRCAHQYLTAIVEARQRSERLLPASILAAQLGYDVWDTLNTVALISPEHIYNVSLTDDAHTNDLISRQFWASEAKNLILRYIGVSRWTHLITSDSPECKLEEALAVLSTFVGCDPFELSVTFRHLALACQSFLENSGVNLNVHSEEFDLALVAERICTWMREQGFGPPEHAHYHRISNHFPHLFLSNTRRTIPLSLVCIFVTIGQQIGLQVSPVNYPRKVLAHITHPQPLGSSVWVDVTGSLGRNILNYQLDVITGLVEGNIDTQFPDIRSWISPASVPTMLVRSANNILNSLRVRGWDDGTPDEDRLNAGGLYGAACIMALFGGHLDFLSRMLEEDNVLLLDDKAIFVDLILSALPDGTLHKAEALRDVRRRMTRLQPIFSHASNRVQFAVGLCMHHKRFGYTGIITGWDTHCHQSEEWIAQMQIDSLPRGRNQPFYHVLSIPGTVYYVAEENIGPAHLNPALALKFIKGSLPIGQYFKTIVYATSKTGYGYMVPTNFLSQAYPEDEAAIQGFCKTARYPTEEPDTKPVR